MSESAWTQSWKVSSAIRGASLNLSMGEIQTTTGNIPLASRTSRGKALANVLQLHEDEAISATIPVRDGRFSIDG